MPKISEELLNRHLKTHTVRAADDRAAITVLQTFLRFDGRINTNFQYGDKWPNTDGTFEFVSNPEISKRPEQNFIVQIKSTQDNFLKATALMKLNILIRLMMRLVSDLLFMRMMAVVPMKNEQSLV